MSNTIPERGDTVKRTELRLPDELYGKLLDVVFEKKKNGETGASLNQEIVIRLEQSFEPSEK